MSKPEIVIVAAVAENRMIGKGNGLPWHLPGDLKHFKEATMGKPAIMGRRSFESLDSPLPGRLNIVITRNKDYRAEGVRVVPDLAGALAVATEEAERTGAREISILGGAEIYAAAIPLADRMNLTEVHASPDGDTRFPKFDRGQWREISRSGPHQGPGDEYSYSFAMYGRR